MLFGLVNINGRNKLERDIRRDQKKKRILFNIIYGSIGFILLNAILYTLTTS
jgi:hypothetical protein